uniref:Glutathione peroxidase n=1 Tax=Arion vulgaris TaxID=1028688 RepID=A0A0B7ABP2_9EUPU
MQEPGSNGTEILNGIKYVRPGNGFVPNFQIFEKVEVNGNNEHKLFTYLKSYCPPTAISFDPKRLFYTPIKANDVSWNWETFLVDADGRVIHRVSPSADPQSLEVDIEAALTKARHNN